MLPSEEAGKALARLCSQLMDSITRGQALNQPNLSALIQILSSVGHMRPDIFVLHAPVFADFVLRSLLPCGALPGLEDDCNGSGAKLADTFASAPLNAQL